MQIPGDVFPPVPEASLRLKRVPEVAVKIHAVQLSLSLVALDTVWKSWLRIYCKPVFFFVHEGVHTAGYCHLEEMRSGHNTSFAYVWFNLNKYNYFHRIINVVGAWYETPLDVYLFFFVLVNFLFVLWNRRCKSYDTCFILLGVTAQ